jgi:hypothetical protein
MSTPTEAATEWLAYWLTSKGGEAPSADAKRASRTAGHAYQSLYAARHRLGLLSRLSRSGHDAGTTYWRLPR